MSIGPCANVAHQAFVSGAFHHNCKYMYMQCVVYSRSVTNDQKHLLFSQGVLPTTQKHAMFTQGVLQMTQKHAIVRPRLKKPTLLI